ncbi:transmembrane protein 235 [Esox lucius]|uniref:transmembrane protein 235 n=1 Tax=Esox lucius TaxID=8010 RepID=UPI000576BEFD|nr:transmembrane protein 235 [Esox lucius]
MKYGVIVITAGFSGLLSFSFLAVAIGSDYWYIIDVSRANHSDLEELSSHSGLWRIREGSNATSWPIHSIFLDTSNNTEIEKHLISSHKVIVTLLPLSLLLVVLGGICGLVSSLSRNPNLLAGSASYFLFCSLFTLSGVCVYISYCQRAQEALEPEILASIHVSYGWSLGLACVSFGLEVAAGLLLMVAARIAYLMGHDDHGVIIAMAGKRMISD